MTIRPILRSFLCLLCAVAVGGASAAGYPEKPVRVVVAYAAGGAVDSIAREMAARLSETWSQAVVVDNRPGATGALGAQAVLAAQPDGYTLLMTASSPVVVVPAMTAKPPHDYLADFIPVATVATWDLILVVHPSLQVSDVKGLVAHAKSAPKPLSYASAGTGGVNHIAGATFTKVAGVDMIHVPYKGDGPAVADLLGGLVTMSFLSSQVALPQLQAGKLKALAIAGANRMAVLPDVPTMAEAGIADFDFSAWTGLFASRGTPAAVIRDVQEAVARAMNQPQVRAKLLQGGSVVSTSTSQAFADHIRRESAKWRRLIQLTGIKAE